MSTGWRSELRRIEAAAGIPIAVAHDPSLPPGAWARTDFAFGLAGERVRVTIQHLEPEPKPEDMWHEVLHCQLALIEGVPKLFMDAAAGRLERRDGETGELLPDTPCAHFSADHVDNEIEHLTILPRLGKLGLDWQANAQFYLRQRWEIGYGATGVRFHLLDWVSVDILLPPHSAVRRTARDVLGNVGLWREARDLAWLVRGALASPKWKEVCLLLILGALQFFPLEGARLVHVPLGRSKPLPRTATFRDPAGKLVTAAA